MSYTNTSKNYASYTNQSETASSVLSYLLTEDGYYMTQQDESLIALEQAGTYNTVYEYPATYTNQSK